MRVGLLMMVVVGAGLTAPVGFAAETETSAVTVSAESGARFLADFDGNGFKDLAVGVPGEDLGSALDAGAVNVIYASANGLTGTASQLWTQNSPGIFDEAEQGDEFGESVAVADFDGDGFGDLAIGVPFEDANAGAVHVLYGSPTGLTAAGSQFWTQNSPGIPDEAEDGDWFGCHWPRRTSARAPTLILPSAYPRRTRVVLETRGSARYLRFTERADGGG